jgi:hypothetical protein
VPAASTPQANAIVVVKDAALASSLEMALQAAGFAALVHDPAAGLANLPLDVAMTLIVEDRVLKPSPAAFVARLRSRPWLGLVVLVTGDADDLRAAFAASDRVTILEMPFLGADLIAAIRAI